MELIKSATSRNRLSNIGHIGLNLLYVAFVVLLLLSFEGPYLAYGVVLLSKWRIFAVRPRFWRANIQTNFVDIMFALGVVTLMWQNTNNKAIVIGLAGLFAVWLIFIKPSSKQFWIVIQAGLAQFVGLSALFTVAHTLPNIAVAASGGVIGYFVARHVVHVYSEELDDVTISMVWGLVLAELSWLTFFWTVAYTPLKITQIAIVASLLGYMVLVVYNYLYHRERGTAVHRDLTLPVAFSLTGITLLLILFNFFDPTSL